MQCPDPDGRELVTTAGAAVAGTLPAAVLAGPKTPSSVSARSGDAGAPSWEATILW